MNRSSIVFQRLYIPQKLLLVPVTRHAVVVLLRGEDQPGAPSMKMSETMWMAMTLARLWLHTTVTTPPPWTSPALWHRAKTGLPIKGLNKQNHCLLEIDIYDWVAA